MQGQILVFNEQKEAGVIISADNVRRLFHLRDWQDVMPPEAGMAVEFTLGANGQPQQIQLALPEPLAQPNAPAAVPIAQRPKRKSMLTLFTLFLGGFGAHRFYMGAWGLGLVQLFGLLFIGVLAELLPVMGGLLYLALVLLLVVELVRYILMSDAEFDTKLKGYQAARPGPFSLFW